MEVTQNGLVSACASRMKKGCSGKLRLDEKRIATEREEILTRRRGERGGRKLRLDEKDCDTYRGQPQGVCPYCKKDCDFIDGGINKMETAIMELHVPKWVKEEKGEVDIIRSLSFGAFAKMEYYQSRMLSFEKKYGMPYERFEKRMKNAKEEHLEEWDNFIIWEGFHQAYCEWQERYNGLKKCMRV
ncbi:MAG: hypothetical protein ABH870_01510 [bacterium]